MIEVLPILAAGWNELISILVGLVFLVLWVLGQISDANKKKQPPQGGRRPAPPKPAQPAGAVGGAGVGQQADPLRAQVDEFLRRAGQQRGPQAVPAPGRQMPAKPPRRREEVVVLLDEKSAQAAARPPLAQPLGSIDQPPATRGGGLAAKHKPRLLRRETPTQPQTVAQHVAEYVGTSTKSILDEVSHLGESVIQADQRFDVELHQKFDHDLGSLAARRDERLSDQQVQPTADSPASQIAAMLANPDGVRQAILLNEILRRPTDHW
jgi:hypothetical protein